MRKRIYSDEQLLDYVRAVCRSCEGKQPRIADFRGHTSEMPGSPRFETCFGRFKVYNIETLVKLAGVAWDELAPPIYPPREPRELSAKERMERHKRAVAGRKKGYATYKKRKREGVYDRRGIHHMIDLGMGEVPLSGFKQL